MLAHFGALAGARAALAQQAAAGQERLAQGWARLQQYRKEAGSKLLCTNDELAQLHARLEATRHDVLQWVRGDMGCPRTPSREEGQQYGPRACCRGEMPNVVVVVGSWAAPPGLSWGSPCAQKASSATVHGRIHCQDSWVPLSWLGGGRGHRAVAGGGPKALCCSVPQESCWAHIQSTATQKTLLLGQIKLAVLNLFQLVTTRLKVPADVALEDTEAQLDTVSAALSPACGAGGNAGTFTSPDGWGIKVPISAGAALHAGPGCHLCRAAPQAAGAMSPTLARCHQHAPAAPRGCQGASEPGIAPGDNCLLPGLGRGCHGQHGAAGPLETPWGWRSLPDESRNPHDER